MATAGKLYSHEVFDPRTGQVVGKYQSAQAARNRRDRLDLQYGAARYVVRLIASTTTGSAA